MRTLCQIVSLETTVAITHVHEHITLLEREKIRTTQTYRKKRSYKNDGIILSSTDDIKQYSDTFRSRTMEDGHHYHIPMASFTSNKYFS